MNAQARIEAAMPQLAGEQLEAAFNMFNQLSEQLTQSYGELERQASQLADELAEARSERLRQLAEKERLAQQLEVLINTLPAAVIVVDGRGCVKQCNANARTLFAASLLGDDWQRIAQKSFVQMDDGIRMQNGRWVTIRTRPLRGGSRRRITGKIVLVTDVTEMRERELMANQQRRLTSLGEMLASLAHQIRTPLSSALLYLDNINHPGAGSEDRLRYTEKAGESLRHLERMVNDMLIFARGDVAESRCFTVETLMRSLCELIEPQFERAGVALRTPGRFPALFLNGNRDALVSVFQNIASNAIDAMQDNEHGKPAMFSIDVTAEGDDGVCFRFTDTGCGFDEEIRKRVLEPFFTTRSSGTGLGLAVLHETVKRHRGTIEIQSQPAIGSCFIVRLPVGRKDRTLNSNMTTGKNDEKPTTDRRFLCEVSP